MAGATAPPRWQWSSVSGRLRGENGGHTAMLKGASVRRDLVVPQLLARLAVQVCGYEEER